MTDSRVAPLTTKDLRRGLEQLAQEWPSEPFVFIAPCSEALAWWQEHFPSIPARLAGEVPEQ